MKSGKKKKKIEPKTPQYAVRNQCNWEGGGRERNVVFHPPLNVGLRGTLLLRPVQRRYWGTTTTRPSKSGWSAALSPTWVRLAAGFNGRSTQTKVGCENCTRDLTTARPRCFQAWLWRVWMSVCKPKLKEKSVRELPLHRGGGGRGGEGGGVLGRRRQAARSSRFWSRFHAQYCWILSIAFSLLKSY